MAAFVEGLNMASASAGGPAASGELGGNRAAFEELTGLTCPVQQQTMVKSMLVKMKLETVHISR